MKGPPGIPVIGTTHVRLCWVSGGPAIEMDERAGAIGVPRGRPRLQRWLRGRTSSVCLSS